MLLSKEDISIGVTVFRRLEFLEQALGSAVNQTVPVKVHLYDDGCQDQKGLQRILARFTGRVEYHRNPKTLGLFQNMNQCIWNSPTPWISVLHDDDALEADFVERVLAVAPSVEACSLFCGGTQFINARGIVYLENKPNAAPPWQMIDTLTFALRNQFAFPGQLMHTATARKVGGFPAKSLLTGDWDLWFRLTLAGGTVQLGANLSYYRCYVATGRGTTIASKTGRKAACTAMQVKHNLARLRRGSHEPSFDRVKWVKLYGPLYRDLLIYSWYMPGRLLRYNRRLLLLMPPRSWTSRLLHWISKIAGNPGIRLAGLARTLGEWFGIPMPQPF
jgi:glycosyltransferase involved in cell wall biosynthesis